jgi:hypothetical protein
MPTRKVPKEPLKLYEQYGKPLEQDHWGECVAIFPDGKTFIGVDLIEVSRWALSEIGKGSFIFKVGERVVGKAR